MTLGMLHRDTDARIDTGNAFVIDSPSIETTNGVTELSAMVDGHRVWFRCPESRAPRFRGDPFLAVALLPAMRSGRRLVISEELPTSPQLLAQLKLLQQIYNAWYPWARIIPIEAARVSSDQGGSGHGALFSGGVDSSYSLLKGEGSLTHILFIDRVDTGKQADSARYHEALESHREIATAFGVELIEASTNAKEFGHLHGVNWQELIGAGLSAVAMVTGLATLWFPSSSPWSDLGAFGTHPLTDPLWSTEAIQVVHHGTEARRIDKLALVGNDPRLLHRLRVCMEGVPGNCGRCEKCLRTMVGLRVLGLESVALPPLKDLSLIRNTAIRFDGILLDWEELLEPELSRTDPPLAKAIGALIRRYRVRQALRTIDDHLLSGAAARFLGRSRSA